MKRLAIIGSGDLGQQIAHHALEDKHYQPVGFFDDFQIKGAIRHGYPILGGKEDIAEAYAQGAFDFLMIGIGYKHFAERKFFFDLFAGTIPFANIIHSSSYIDKTSVVGFGVFIYPGCTLDMNTRIGNNVLINTGCVIAHDSTIGPHSFLSPAVSIAGFVAIDECVSLGIGTVVIDNISLSTGVKTGAGAVVVDNLSEPGLYLGIPAKLKK